MGHKMTHIDGLPVVIGGYNDDLMRSIEFFEDGAWRVAEQELDFGRLYIDIHCTTFIHT